MIRVRFYRSRGFDISGHASNHCRDEEGKLVCAAVSSAAYLTANTLTDVLKLNAGVHVNKDQMSVRVSRHDAKKPACAGLLQGLWMHLCSLRQQYPKRIEIKMMK